MTLHLDSTVSTHKHFEQVRTLLDKENEWANSMTVCPHLSNRSRKYPYSLTGWFDVPRPVWERFWPSKIEYRNIVKYDYNLKYPVSHLNILLNVVSVIAKLNCQQPLLTIQSEMCPTLQQVISQLQDFITWHDLYNHKK